MDFDLQLIAMYSSSRQSSLHVVVANNWRSKLQSRVLLLAFVKEMEWQYYLLLVAIVLATIDVEPCHALPRNDPAVDGEGVLNMVSG